MSTLLEMSNLAAPAAADRLYIVDDPAGSPLDRYLLWSQIVASGDVNEHDDGTFATSLGIGTLATQANQVAIGKNITIATQYAVAVGESAVADQSQTVAFGYLARATGSASTAFGSQAQASATNALAIGSASIASADQAVAVGASAQATGASSTAIGKGATAALQAVAVGEGTNANATYATAVGEAASASSSCSSFGRNAQSIGTGNTALGRDSLANNASGESIAAGYGANATAWRTTAIGRGAFATATSSTALGWGAYASQVHSLALGRGAEATTETNMVELGGEGMRNIYFGVGSKHRYDERITGNTVDNPPTANPVTLHGPDAFDDAAVPINNVAGGDLRLAAGRGTGTAIGGKVTIQAAPAGGVSNNTKNALVDVAEFDLSVTAGDLRLLVYSVDAGAMVRVSSGAADSESSGFRSLRIPN